MDTWVGVFAKLNFPFLCVLIHVVRTDMPRGQGFSFCAWLTLSVDTWEALVPIGSQSHAVAAFGIILIAVIECQEAEA